LDEAIEDFTATIRLAPQFADAYAQRGLAYFNRGDFDRAAADFERAKELGVEVEQPPGSADR
jgi:tetratricopeptide (TPR) repeat protein